MPLMREAELRAVARELVDDVAFTSDGAKARAIDSALANANKFDSVSYAAFSANCLVQALQQDFFRSLYPYDGGEVARSLIAKDVQYIADFGDMSVATRLWWQEPWLYEERWSRTKALLVDFESHRGATGHGAEAANFWVDWYESVLSGKTIDPALLTEVALVPSEDWNHPGSPEHVFGIIRNIYEKYQIREKIWQLQIELEDLKSEAASAAHRGHNRPPELLEVHDAEEINDRLSDADIALAERTPDREHLRKIALALRSAAIASARKLGGYADTFIESALQELGSSTAKWLVRGGAALAIAKALHISDLIIKIAGV